MKNAPACRQASVPRGSGLSGRLTFSAACQRVAPYSSRRLPARSPTRGRVKSCSLRVATAPLILPRVKHGPGLLRRTPVGNGLKPFPTEDFAGLPKPQLRQGRLVPPVAGGILDKPENRILHKMLWVPDQQIVVCSILPQPVLKPC